MTMMKETNRGKNMLGEFIGKELRSYFRVQYENLSFGIRLKYGQNHQNKTHNATKTTEKQQRATETPRLRYSISNPNNKMTVCAEYPTRSETYRIYEYIRIVGCLKMKRKERVDGRNQEKKEGCSI